MAGGHDGAGSHGGVDFGAPGSHGLGELHGHHSHGGGLSGEMDGDGAAGRRVGLSGKGACITMVQTHFDIGYQDHFSPPETDGAAPAGPVANPDPLKDSVSIDEAERTGKMPTRVYWAYSMHHNLFDHAGAVQHWSREISQQFARGDSPILPKGLGVFRKLQAFVWRVRHMLDPKRRALIRIDTRVPSINGTVDQRKSLLSFYTAQEDPKPEDMPAGWAPGMTGTTEIVKQVYQIGVYNAKDKCYIYDRHCKTFIEVMFVVWKFDQTSTFTTKFVVNVKSLWQYDLAKGKYGMHRRSFEEHQLLAQWLVKHLSEELADAKPSAAQLRLLEDFAAGVKRPKHQPGWGTAPDDVAKELEAAGLSSADRADHDPRRTGGKPNSGGVGYLDSPGGVGSGVDPDASAAPAMVDDPDAASKGAPLKVASGADLENVLPGSTCTTTESQPPQPKSKDGLWQPKKVETVKVPVKK